MPEKKPIARARQDEREGKAPSTQAGEFVREEIELISRRGARRALDEAGDCDRSFQSAARGGEAAAAEERNRPRKDARKGETRPRKSAGRRRETNVAETFASHAQGAQARRPRRCVETSTLEACALGRSGQERCRTLRRRENGRSNSREAISRARWAIYSAAMGGACTCGNCIHREEAISRRVIAARTTIRQIRAAGEPFQGTVLPRSSPRGNAVSQR
jgi:hypothetical protein